MDKVELTKEELELQIKTASTNIAALMNQIEQYKGVISYCQHLLEKYNIKDTKAEVTVEPGNK